MLRGTFEKVHSCSPNCSLQWGYRLPQAVSGFPKVMGLVCQPHKTDPQGTLRPSLPPFPL